VAGHVAQPGPFAHAALFYRTPSEFLAQVVTFLRTGLTAREPAFVAVPPAQIGWLRDTLGTDADSIRFEDMTSVGRNPAWIMPVVRDFVDEHRGRRVRYVGQPVWDTRTMPELREATRHEALLNLAFAEADVAILCPYDASHLTRTVIADARRTHPALVTGGTESRSQVYAGPGSIPPSCQTPLARLPHDGRSLEYSDDLRALRAEVSKRARQANLPGRKVVDLVLAVSELAANTVRHTRWPGTLDIAVDEREIACTIRDRGRITDPLAGRKRPPAGAPGGQGLWLVHQVCDLVEMRSDESGTAIRLHMSLS
jgi:anti-sigma regulatory factor (Ser/Thr protein kinase)